MAATEMEESGFRVEGSLSSTPHTPPYTPVRVAKRRLERSDSPASAIGSVHTADIESPAKKAPRTCINDEIKIEELGESDLGYMTDIDVVYPEELEEISSSDSEPDTNSRADVSESDAKDLTRRLSRLRCGDDRDVTFENNRHFRHVSKRTGARRFKRTHSQSVKGEADTDIAPDDQDHKSRRRRLRRRTKSPAMPGQLSADEAVIDSAELSTASMYSTAPGTPSHTDIADPIPAEAMEIDDGT